MALTKVKLIADGVITSANLDASHGITTSDIGEGSNLYYTDSRVSSYLSTNGFATQTDIVAAITDSAPVTLDTLNELAAALGDDPNFATTTATSLGLKAPLASPSFTGNVGIKNTVASTIDSASALGTLVVGDGSSVEGITIYTGTSNYGGLNFADATSGGGAYAGYIKFDHSDNSFGHYIGNVERMHIDSSGDVGIGTTSLTNTSGYNTLSISGTTGAQIAFQTSGVGKHYIYSTATDFDIYNSQAGNLKLYTNSTERMRINSVGDMIIKDYGNIYASTNNSTVNSGIYFGGTDNTLRSYTNNAERMRITSGGDVIIGGTVVENPNSVNRAFEVAAASPVGVILNDTRDANPITLENVGAVFHISHGTNRRLTILDSSGNVGIGTTSPDGKLQITAASSTTSNGNDASFKLYLTNTDTTNNNYSLINFTDSDGGASSGGMGLQYTDHTNNYGDLCFITRGAVGYGERMRITSGGNINIGSGSLTQTAYQLRVDADVNNGIYLSAGSSSSNHAFYVENTSGSAEHFAVRGDGQIRLNASRTGDVLFGCTALPSASVFGSAFKSDSKARYTLMQSCNSTALSDLQEFFNPNGAVGKIQTSGSATLFTTSSDYRLKENVVEMTGALDRISQLKPSRFNFIADANKTVDGFLAHEVQDIVPEAITGTKDEVDEEGNPVYQGIDQSKLVPLLVGAIKELKADNDNLRERIQTLENQ